MSDPGAARYSGVFYSYPYTPSRIFGAMSAFTEDRKTLFLHHLRETCNATKAADLAGVSTSTVSKHRREDTLFAERYQEVLDEGIDLLEHLAQERAFRGTLRERFDKDGNCVSSEMVYSDTLTMFLLKAYRPEKYRERSQIDIKGEISISDTLREARQRAAQRDV